MAFGARGKAGSIDGGLGGVVCFGQFLGAVESGERLEMAAAGGTAGQRQERNNRQPSDDDDDDGDDDEPGMEKGWR